MLRHSDLHRSALAAERSIELDSGVPSTLLRCSLHRCRTTEQHVLAVDPTTESFLVNATLSFRQKTGFTRVALQRAMTFALQNAQIYCGQPPDEVQQWRARMASVLWPHPPRTKAEARRKFVWDHVLNGDVRLQTELQHFCSSPERCPDGIESFRAKLQQPHGIAALLSPAPVNFPRRSWQGQHASGGHILQLLCTHSLLLHMPFDNDVLDYLRRSDAAQNPYLAVRTLARTDELKRAAVGRCVRAQADVPGIAWQLRKQCLSLSDGPRSQGPALLLGVFDPRCVGSTVPSLGHVPSKQVRCSAIVIVSDDDSTSRIHLCSWDH